MYMEGHISLPTNEKYGRATEVWADECVSVASMQTDWRAAALFFMYCSSNLVHGGKRWKSGLIATSLDLGPWETKEAQILVPDCLSKK